MGTPNPEDVVRVQARVCGLLNEVESLLTGWVLGYDRDEVGKLTEPLYDLCDTDTPPSQKGA